MNQASLNEKLDKEKEKLYRLVDEALKNGIPLAQDEAVIAQSRKIDVLIVKLQREMEGQRKNSAGTIG